MTIPTTPFAADGQLISGPVLLRGWAVENQNGGSVDYFLYDGMDTNGTQISKVHMTSGANSSIWFGGPGLLCEIGLFLHATGFALSGAVYVVPLEGPFAEALESAERELTQAGHHGPGG